jgi:hypothetical protein
MLFQEADDGNVTAVHVVPLVDTAADVPPLATATNLEFPKATDTQFAADGNAPIAVQFTPLSTEYDAAVEEVVDTAIK